VGPTTVRVTAGVEIPPPGAGVNTVTPYVPASDRSAASTGVVSDVPLTTVVVGAAPLKCATDVPTKLVPVTVSTNGAAPCATVVTLRLVTVGAGGGGTTVHVSPFDVPPPGVPVTTVIVCVVLLVTT